MAYQEREKEYKKIEKLLDCKVISYILGDQDDFSESVSFQHVIYFKKILNQIGFTKRIAIILHTYGGNGLAATALIQLVKECCDELIVIVPDHAMSAGTIISLAANQIYLNRTSLLSPVDGSSYTDFNPKGNDNDVASVSNIDLLNYFDFAREKLNLSNEDLSEAFSNISKNDKPIHPLTLGACYRHLKSDRIFIKNLLSKNNLFDQKFLEETIAKLSDTYPHSWSFSFSYIKDELHLPAVLLTGELKQVIDNLYNDYAEELCLDGIALPNLKAKEVIKGKWLYRTSLIESTKEYSRFDCTYHSTKDNYWCEWFEDDILNIFNIE